MARNNFSPVQQFRGTTAQHETYTGLPGELTVDTDKNVVIVHDGVTAGGVPMARADHRHPEYSISTASGTVSGTTKLSDATNSTSDVNSGVAATPKAVKAAYDKAVEAQNIGILLGIDWIGVPRYWRSTNLPPNHCWANGDFVEFADWPQLEQVYNAGGFEGMLMAWNADSKTKAANLGKWRPDAAKPTGLYTPNLTGQFLRCWADGGDESAGAWHRDEIRNITGVVYDHHFGIGPSSSGALIYAQAGLKGHSASGSAEKYGKVSLDASQTVPTGVQNVPQHVWQPVIIYLGQPSA